MTRSEVRRILWGYQNARVRLLRATMEKSEIYDMMTSISIDYSKVRVVSSSSSDRMSNLMIRLENLMDKVDIAVKDATSEMQRVRDLIDLVEDVRTQEVLTRRYIVGEQWKDIADEMGTDVRWLLRRQAKGIDEIIWRNKW